MKKFIGSVLIVVGFLLLGFNANVVITAVSDVSITRALVIATVAVIVCALGARLIKGSSLCE